MVNWVDFIIVLVLLWFVWDGWKKGIFWLAAQFMAFVGSLVVAFWSYAFVAVKLVQWLHLSHGIAKAVGFLAIAAIAEHLLYELLGKLIVRLPKRYFPRWWSGVMSIGPSAINGGVFVAFVLAAVVALPLRPQLKRAVLDSQLGTFFINRAVVAEQAFNGVFGEVARETLSFLTIPVKSEGRVNLGFTVPTSEYRVDPESELQLFGLVNQERGKQGLPGLQWYPEALDVARAHSGDMLRRGYFSHVSPEGKNVGDRLQAAGISYVVAGENLALAPTITVAHQGLMNSPGHRANILSPEFSRVAIGVIDGGGYGKMVTQVFVN